MQTLRHAQRISTLVTPTVDQIAGKRQVGRTAAGGSDHADGGSMLGIWTNKGVPPAVPGRQ